MQQNALKCQPCGYDDDDDDDDDDDLFVTFDNTGGPPYPWVICFKTYRSYMKLQIIPNGIYNMI